MQKLRKEVDASEAVSGRWRLMIYTGVKVYDPLTDTYSTGYWIKDDKGNWYPIWLEIETSKKEGGE